MQATVAKNNTPSHTKRTAFEIPLSLQENLTTAIHGAFEVAVEIAVLEVTKLISAAAGDMFEKIRHENETLKEELQKAQSVIDSVCSQAGTVSNQTSQPLRDDVVSNTATAHNVSTSEHERKATRSVDQSPPNKHHHNLETGQYFASRDDEDDVSGLQEQRNNWTTDEDEQNKCQTLNNSNDAGISKEISHDYDVKVERTNQACMGEKAESPPAVSFADNGAPQLVKVKVEKPEELLMVSDGLVNSFKEDAISQLQSDIMQDWTPGVSHFESQVQNVTLQAHAEVHGQPSNMNFSLDLALDSASALDVNFPGNVSDQALTQDSSPLHNYGSPIRRNQGNIKSNIHTCKLCGLNFPLPSLLRRHYGQCQHKHNQRIYVPAVGGKRTKLQLYPPGCSPFRCLECNRDFNRLENLKTHLRIHTGERPYKCSVCSTAFRHSGALTRHFRIHTGEKPYVCGLCGKSFRNCGGLKFHQRSHNKALQI